MPIREPLATDPRLRVGVVQTFRELGYDMLDVDDVRELAADLRWVSERRKREESYRQRWSALAVSSAVAVVGFVLTVVGQWVTRRYGG